MDIDTGQCGEHELLGNLVDQRHTQTFLQVHQHLGTDTKKASEDRRVSHGETMEIIVGLLQHLVPDTDVSQV